VTDTVLFEIAVYRTSLETWRKEVNDYIDKNDAPWVIERFLGSLRARDVSSGHGGLRTPDSRFGSDPR
jgi:hypothetical protein